MGIVLENKNIKGKNILSTVGFEPTHANILDLKSSALDHSAKLTIVCLNPSCEKMIAYNDLLLVGEMVIFLVYIFWLVKYLNITR